jgi:hypothetical protein
LLYRPRLPLQEPVFDPVPFLSKSLTLLSTFICSPKQTYTFPAHYATFHRFQLIVIAPPTIINIKLIISSSTCSIIAPVMLIFTRPAYYQSHFPLVAVNCPFLYHRHHKPSSQLLLKSQLDHHTNSTDLHYPDHFSRHFPKVAIYFLYFPTSFNILYHHSFTNLTTKSHLKSMLIRCILDSLQRNPEESQASNHHQSLVKCHHSSLTKSYLSSLAKSHLSSLARSPPLSLAQSHLFLAS